MDRLDQLVGRGRHHSVRDPAAFLALDAGLTAPPEAGEGEQRPSLVTDQRKPAILCRVAALRFAEAGAWPEAAAVQEAVFPNAGSGELIVARVVPWVRLQSH